MLTELAFCDPQSGLIEQRRLKRWQLVNYLRVFDAKNGNLVGHLVDINQEGIMILGTHPLAINETMELRMERLSDGVLSNIFLAAQSQWTKVDKDPHFYNTGFKLISPSEDGLSALQALINELNLNQQP
jgi:hypothetical protein